MWSLCQMTKKGLGSRKKLCQGCQNSNKGATMWTPIGSDHTFIMIDPLGLGFFDATFVFKVPGAPPQKNWPNPVTGRCIFDSVSSCAFDANRTLDVVNPLGLRFFEVIIVTTVPGVPKKKFRQNPTTGRWFFDFSDGRTNGRTD